MHTAALNRFEFSAARRAGRRWRGDNFTAWVGVDGDSFPSQAAVALFTKLDGGPLNSSLGIERSDTTELARAIWRVLAEGFESPVRLESLALAEEDGGAAILTGARAWTVSWGIFSAAHRTHAPALSDQENAALYGKCDNPAGHGHNYRVELWCPAASDSDPVNTHPGQAGLRAVIAELDHKNLSLDIPDLRGRNVVTEAVAALIAGRVPAAGRVRVWETPDFFAEYRRGTPDYRLGRDYHFQAAHRAGPAIAGHNYRVRAVIKSPLDPRTEAAFDLAVLDRMAAGILDPLDHSFLDEDVPYFHDRPANGPNLLRFLWTQFEAQLGQGLDSLRLQPAPRSRFWIERDPYD
jgi:6-pyruvoyltetrahydropterin/6-carboxytetrahydropterin synthase